MWPDIHLCLFMHLRIRSQKSLMLLTRSFLFDGSAGFIPTMSTPTKHFVQIYVRDVNSSSIRKIRQRNMRHLTNSTCFETGQLEISLFPVNETLVPILMIPSLLMNGWIVHKFYKLSPSARKKNSSLFIFTQACSNIFHVAFICPLIIAANRVVYKTEQSFHQQQSESHTRLCRVFYICSSWLMVMSILGRLGVLVLSSLDRLLSVTRPLYWYAYLNSKYKECRILLAIVWFCSCVVSLGETVVHSHEFNTGRTNETRCFHRIRSLVCLVLFVLVLVVWLATLVCGLLALRDSRRIRSTSNAAARRRRISDDSSGVVHTLSKRIFVIEPTSDTPNQNAQCCSTSSLRIAKEWKLVRAYSVMLLVFVVGYAPIFIYIMSYLWKDENRSYFSTIVRVSYVTSSTGIACVACFTPLFSLIYLKQFKGVALFKRIRLIFSS